MSKTNTWENDLLLLLFNNTNASLIGDATGLRASTTAGSIFISLHTADPGETGTQTTSEAGYTGYARIGVVRSAAGWTVSGTAPTQVTNVGAITFGACSAGTSTVTHFGVGTDVSGVGKLLYKGTLTPTIVVAVGITPQISASGLVVTED